jgi:hypothetical protein
VLGIKSKALHMLGKPSTTEHLTWLYLCMYICIYLYIGGAGVWTQVQVFTFAKQEIYTWATPLVYFALVILETGILWTIYLLGLSSNYNPPNLSFPSG